MSPEAVARELREVEALCQAAERVVECADGIAELGGRWVSFGIGSEHIEALRRAAAEARRAASPGGAEGGA